MTLLPGQMIAFFSSAKRFSSSYVGWLLDWGVPSASPQSQPSFVVGPRALNYFRSGLLAL